MASIVTDVLKNAGKMKREEILNNLPDLMKRVDQLKLEIFEESKSKYIDFWPNLATAEQLHERVNKLSDEMDGIITRIDTEMRDQLDVSTGEFQSLTSKLQEKNAVLKVLNKMTTIQNEMDACSSSIYNSKYLSAANSIVKIQSLVDFPAQSGEKEIEIYIALITEYRVLKEKIIVDIGDVWKNNLTWTISPHTDKNSHVNNQLKIVTTDNCSNVKEAVSALAKLGQLDGLLKVFGLKLLDNFIKPLAENCCSKPTSGLDMEMFIVHSSKKDSEKSSATAVKTIIEIEDLFKWLYSHLFSYVIDSNSDVTLICQLGEIAAQSILDFITKELLPSAIPTGSKQLNEFSEVVTGVKALQETLVGMGFITTANSALMDFVGNVNVLFANKKSQEILTKARNFMTSQFHNMTPIRRDSVEPDIPQIDKTPGTKKAKKLDILPDIEMSGNTYRMPSCHISTSVYQLMQLAYETLEDCSSKENTPECNVQLYFAVRNMFELACDVFPVYHRENLKMLPQLTALHHNNCMYIAHHLLTLGHQFSSRLPPNINTTFADLVPTIRRIGTSSFIQQLERQKYLLLELLRNAGDFSGMTSNENYFKLDKAVKQILHQLRHLHAVWHDVLPTTTYRRVMGNLLNCVLVEIINSIVALEDISEEDGKNLIDLLTQLSEKSGMLFHKADDAESNTTVILQKFVAKWLKFVELLFIMKARLMEINDRWAEGKGPIANEFSSSEVRQLIRALFQNSDRRSAVLAKIK